MCTLLVMLHYCAERQYCRSIIMWRDIWLYLLHQLVCYDANKAGKRHLQTYIHTHTLPTNTCTHLNTPAHSSPTHTYTFITYIHLHISTLTYIHLHTHKPWSPTPHPPLTDNSLPSQWQSSSSICRSVRGTQMESLLEMRMPECYRKLSFDWVYKYIYIYLYMLN